MPPQYFNRSEDEIELQSTRDANFGKVAVVSKPRPPEQYQGGRLFDDNLLFEAPLTQLEPNMPLLLPRDEEDSEEADGEEQSGKTKGSQPPHRPDPRYLVYAFSGCVCFASGGILRKYQGSNVFVANSMITISFLIIALIHFLIQFIKQKAKGEKYHLPWQTKAHTEFGEVVLTDKAILFYIFIGGGLEFVGAQASVISFNGALSAGLNGGICGAIIALNTVFILVAAYFLFKESLNKVKLISICCLVTSVILVSLFTPSYSDVI